MLRAYSRIIFAAISVWIATSAVTFAQVQLRFEGRTQAVGFTGPTQNTNDITTLRVMPRRGLILDRPSGLAAIIITEKGDEPCALRAIYEQLVPPPVTDTRTYRQVEIHDLNNAGSGCDADDNTGRIELRAAATNPSGHFLTSIGTCTNNKNNDRGLLVKGLTGTKFSLDNDGQIGSTSVLAPDQQPSCMTATYTYSRCPARHVAMGMDVRLKVIGNKQAIVGLQLRCKLFGPVPDTPFNALESDRELTLRP